MQLNPRYDATPILALDGSPTDIVGPAVRQRERLVAALADFDEERWAQATRCEGWSARDVIVHLDSTNAFWAFSINAGLAGEPTRFLATFDPVASPAQLVAASDLSGPAVFERFAASTEAFTTLLASLDDAQLSVLAEAPPGHLAVSAVAHHALWDSWIHERDILLPQGEEPEQQADEVGAALRYALALGPAFAVSLGRAGPGTLSLAVTDPDLVIDIEVEPGETVAVRSGTGDAAVPGGDATDLLEALSIRRPLDVELPDEWRRRFGGLAEIFDAEPA